MRWKVLCSSKMVRRLIQGRKGRGKNIGQFPREEMERMRDHIYKEVDKNGDLMLDYSEFLAGIEESRDKDKNWETVDNETFFNETEFDEYEKQRVGEIRRDIGEGNKPKGYEFNDVPLLNDNFLNETHIR